MHDCHLVGETYRIRIPPEHTIPDVGRVQAIMTAVQSHGSLGEDAPNKTFGGILLLRLQVQYCPPKVSIAAIFHVKMKILADLEVLAVVIGNNVLMSEGRKDLKLGMQLFSLLLRHSAVRYFLAAEDEPIGLSTDFSNNAKRAMACIWKRDVSSVPKQFKAAEHVGRSYQSFPAPRTYRKTWWRL